MCEVGGAPCRRPVCTVAYSCQRFHRRPQVQARSRAREGPGSYGRPAQEDEVLLSLRAFACAALHAPCPAHGAFVVSGSEHSRVVAVDTVPTPERRQGWPELTRSTRSWRSLTGSAARPPRWSRST